MENCATTTVVVAFRITTIPRNVQRMEGSLRQFISVVIISLSLAALQGNSAYADYNKRVCGGEDQANGCPVSKDIMVGCNPTESQAGEAACSYWESGTKKVFPFHVDRQGSHEGGSCGYVWYGVTCFTSGK